MTNWPLIETTSWTTLLLRGDLLLLCCSFLDPGSRHCCHCHCSLPTPPLAPPSLALDPFGSHWLADHHCEWVPCSFFFWTNFFLNEVPCSFDLRLFLRFLLCWCWVEANRCCLGSSFYFISATLEFWCFLKFVFFWLLFFFVSSVHGSCERFLRNKISFWTFDSLLIDEWLQKVILEYDCCRDIVSPILFWLVE